MPKQLSDAAARQEQADQNSFPRPFGDIALTDPIVWRNGVGLPASYVKEMDDFAARLGAMSTAEVIEAVGFKVEGP